MRISLFSVLLLFFPLVAFAGSPFYDAAPTTNSVDGDFDLNGNSLLDAEDIRLECATCPSMIYMTPRTTDALPRALAITGGNASPIATGANQAGAPVYLGGGLGTQLVTVTDDTISAADTVTIAGTRIDGAAYTDTYTAVAAAPGAGEFVCATDVTTCAANLSALANATASEYTTSPVVGVVHITPVTGSAAAPFTLTITIADGGVDGDFAAATSGETGVIVIGTTNSGASVVFAGDTDSGIAALPAVPNYWCAISGGTYKMCFTATVTNLAANLNSAGSLIYDTTGPLELGTACAVGATGDVCTGGGMSVAGAMSYDGAGANLLWQSDTITTSTSQVPAANAPDLDAAPGGAVTVMRCYPDGADNYLYGQWHAPPGYKDGTDVVVEVYWMADGVDTGTVDWEFAYSECTPGTACAANTVVSVQDAGPGTAYDTQNVAIVTITGTTLVDDSNIFFRLMRDGNDAGNDTLTDKACLAAIETYYQVDAPGKFAATP